MKSARGARFTRGGGHGEGQPAPADRENRSKFSVRDFGMSVCEPADILREPVRAWEERRKQATRPLETIGVPELAPARSRAGAVRFFGSSL